MLFASTKPRNKFSRSIQIRITKLHKLCDSSTNCASYFLSVSELSVPKVWTPCTPTATTGVELYLFFMLNNVHYLFFSLL
jgi:hypothetical protein